MEYLKFRRQFLLTTNSIKYLETKWNSCSLVSQDTTWNLYTHSDLEITVAQNEHCKLVLLGYLLNPFKAESDNQSILKDLIIRNDFNQIVEDTHKLNGRFLLFYLNDKSFKVINDASGFRELYYQEESLKIHCGSTADIIKEYVGAEQNPDEEVFTFFKSTEYSENSHTWVGHETIYKNVRKLPANFMLDLNKQEIKRFWPIKPFKKQNLEVVATKGAEYIRGCLNSAILRKPIHLGITAGWDSRVLLAASKSLKDKIFYYSNYRSELDNKHPDIKIAKALSEKLGFNLNLLSIKDVKEENSVREIYYKNNYRANDILFPVFYYGLINDYDHTITVSGTLAEGSARKYYYVPHTHSNIKGKQLARIVGFKKNRYAIRMLNEWLEDAQNTCLRFNIDVLDLYQIEHEACNWSSHTASEQDIVREELRPFNSRYLISLFWSLNVKHRFLYNPSIYRRMIEILWKETLSQPINPSLKSNLFRLLGIFNLDYFAFKIKVALKYWFYQVK